MSKTIKDYKDYEIDECGNVFVKAKEFADSTGRKQHKPRKELLQQLVIGQRGNGYMTVALYKHRGDKRYVRVKVHRLVAQTFLDNPNHLPVVHHKDGNRLNNHVSNLEWCTYSDNTKEAVKTGMMHNFNRTCVQCVETDKEYISAKQAALALGGKDGSSISKCIKGKQETAYGYHWKRSTTIL